MASSSDGRPSIERDRTVTTQKCVNCGMMTRERDRVQCGLCKSFTHSKCMKIDINIPENVLKALRTKNGNPFVYSCIFCANKLKSDDAPLIYSGNEQLIREQNEKTDKIIEDLKNKLRSETMRVTQKEMLLEDSRRKCKLLKENTGNQAISTAMEEYNAK